MTGGVRPQIPGVGVQEAGPGGCGRTGAGIVVLHQPKRVGSGKWPLVELENQDVPCGWLADRLTGGTGKIV